MPRRRKGVPPPYRLHKASGQAVVTVNGKPEYLGRYGSPESHRRYRAHVRQWERENAGAPARLPKSGCTVDDLCAAFSEHARKHYAYDDGSPTHEVYTFGLSLAPLLARCGEELADEVKPSDLRAARQDMIAAGLNRRVINQRVGRIRRVFRWGVEHELVSAATLLGLEAVRDLQEGRSDAPEPEEVSPADEAAVLATLPFLRPQLRAMVQLEMVSGCRPGEVCRIRGCEINQDGLVHLKKRRVQLPAGVWAWQPGQHKNKRRGKTLVYVLGPRAQEILRPWLREDPEEYLFQPRESVEQQGRERALAKKINRVRKSRRKKNPKRQPGPCYRPGSYWHAVEKAATKAGVEHWSPNQLRHLVATKIDRAEGIESSSKYLGHSSIATTDIYVEKDLAEAARIAALHG